MLILSVMITQTGGIVLLSFRFENRGPVRWSIRQYGEMQGSIVTDRSDHHSSTEGRMCRVSFQFGKWGTLLSGGRNGTAKRPGNVRAGFSTMRLTVCFPHSRCQVSDFIQERCHFSCRCSLHAGRDVADASLVGWLTPGVRRNVAAPAGDLSVILMPPAASDFLLTHCKARRSG